MNMRSRSVRLVVSAAVVALASLAFVTSAASASPMPTAATVHTAAAARTPKCTAADLGVWAAYDQQAGAAGTLVFPLEFTNVSRHTCTLYGFPGVSAIAPNGRQLGLPAAWDTVARPRIVRLVPGATAHAMLFYSNAVASTCPSSTAAAQLRVYPPSQRQADHTLWSLPGCASSQSGAQYLRVRVIAAGIGRMGDTV